MYIKGKTIFLKDISVKDSKFVTFIRNKKNINKFLNNPPPDIKHQLVWTKKNINDKTTRDFIILDKKKKRKIGTIALNDINLKKKEAEWGRWICAGTSSQSIESFLLLSKFSFYNLNLRKIYSLTNQKNTKVINFHKRIGGKYCGLVKNKYLMRGKKTNAVKHTFSKKNYKMLIKKFIILHNL